MDLKESFSMASASLGVHKLRSALTLLGVMVGVFSIVVVMTTIRALQNNIEDEISQLGAQTFRLSRWPVVRVEDDAARQRFFRRKDFTYETLEQLRERATLPRHVAATAGFRTQEAISEYRKTNPNIQLIGATPEAFETQNWVVEIGRGFQPVDIENARRVCVLGNSLAEQLFPNVPALGETVKFDGIGYTVSGVLEAKGGLFGQSQDNFIAIPLTTGLNRYGKEWSLSIQVQAYNQALYADTVEQVRGILRVIRKVPPGEPDDFEIISNDLIIDTFRQFTSVVRIGAAVVSSIALLAAGVGIMNIMLVSVTERTREIGIRRAVGAKKRNILAQFILEAILLCEIGGVMGVVLGVAGGNLAGHFLHVSAVIPMDWVVLGLAICSLVGVAFGTYPAMKAANLDPIDSLRYE